ncbi:MAG: hypothetical protein KGR47_04315 [Acidobacteria bacterium]|nr:hypothetical protein [Acidobacteriota bacterium]
MTAAQLVREAPLGVLLRAWGAPHPFGFIDDDAGTRTVCPRCRRITHNGPTLQVFSSVAMACWSCRTEVNRARIERAVLESPVLLRELALELAVAS